MQAKSKFMLFSAARDRLLISVGLAQTHTVIAAVKESQRINIKVFGLA